MSRMPRARAGTRIAPNRKVEDRYRERIGELIRDMQRSLLYWIGAEYKKEQAKILAYDADAPLWRKAVDCIPALDASPATALQRVLRRRFRQWLLTFEDKAAPLAAWFVSRMNGSATAATAASIHSVSGLTVRFQMNRAMNNAIQSLIHENVALIRSIPQELYPTLEGMVMRSARSGRDVSGLLADIEGRFNVAHGRARTIARDQSNKATESLSRIRMQSVGITQGVWMHSGRSRDPRSTHQRMDGKIFNLDEGLYDSAVGYPIQPGELINCNCTKRPLVPAFARSQRDLERNRETA